MLDLVRDDRLYAANVSQDWMTSSITMHFEGQTSMDLEESLARALFQEPGFAWLDGSGEHLPGGRRSYLATRPSETVTLQDQRGLETFLNALNREHSISDVVGRAPRWIGYVAFDVGYRNPFAYFARYPNLWVVDHETAELFFVGEEPPPAAILERLSAAKSTSPRNGPRASFGSLSIEVNTREDHIERIGHVLREIEKGNVYQVNLARRWKTEFRGDPLSLYLRMRKESPVPNGAFLRTPELDILSRSMETFLDWNQDSRTLSSRPIKGTVSRQESLQKEAQALLLDPKEHAEHTMIVDLMRNDLGRVAVPGSVAVRDAWAVEPYSNLSHLVSTVSCETRGEIRLGEVLNATFPPGSVTGAPKLAAVAQIRAIEPYPRGVYTGAIGFIDHQGGLLLSVAIRTAQLYGQSLLYHAGGGIVADSRPESETNETELKARAFLNSL